MNATLSLLFFLLVTLLTLWPLWLIWSHVRRRRVSNAIDASNDDIFDGWEFQAVLDPHTSLEALCHHRDVYRGPESERPHYGTGTDGVWLPRLKPWSAMVSDPIIAERLRRAERGLAPSTMASRIGPVPTDGGQLLALLKAYRMIVETTTSDTEKRRQVDALFKCNPSYRHLRRRLGIS